MATSLLLEGDDPEALLERAQVEGGPRARIVRMGKVRQGGVMGFFAKERYEVAVEIPDDDDAPLTNDNLLAGLAQRDDRPAEPAARPTSPFERQLAEREAAERRMNLPEQRRPQPERLRPAYGPSAPQVAAQHTGVRPTGPLPEAISPVAAVAPRNAPVEPVGRIDPETATSPTRPQRSAPPVPSYADVQQQVQNRRQEDLRTATHDGPELYDLDDAPALAKHGLLDIVDRVNAVERAATRAVAGQPLGEPGVQFSLPLPRPTTGSRSGEFSLEHEHEQIAASAAFAASYARAHTGAAEDIMTDDVAALAALRQRPFEMATFPAASLGQPLAAADRPAPEPAADQATPEPAPEPEPAAEPEPVVTTIDDLTVRVDTPNPRRQSTPWDDADETDATAGADPTDATEAAAEQPDADTTDVDTTDGEDTDVDDTREIPVVAQAEPEQRRQPEAPLEAEQPDQPVGAQDVEVEPVVAELMTADLMTIATLLPQQVRPLADEGVESIEAEAVAALQQAAEQAAEQARADAAAEAGRRQAELEATVLAQAHALAAAQIAQADSARHEAEQLARQAVEAAERASREAIESATRATREAVESATRATREAVEAAERTALEALQTAERLAGEARASAAEQTRTVAELIAQREEAAATAAVRAERERIGRDAARYWPGQAQPALAAPQRQPLPTGRATGADLIDPVTGEAAAGLWNDSQVLRDRARLRDLGVPVAWTRRLRSGDRLSSVLRMLDGLPQSDLDRSTPVVAVVGPTGGVQFEAHRLALDLHVGNRPRPVVVVPANGVGRVAAMATVHRLETCIVALECDGESDLAAVLEAFEVVQPSAVVAMVDASQPISLTQEWLDALQTVDLVTVDGAVDAVQPAAVLRLGLPVLRLDGAVVDRTAWAALLTARLEADDADTTPQR